MKSMTLLRKDSKITRYIMKPIYVTRIEPWEVSHEFSTLEIEQMMFNSLKGEEICFAEAYKRRWMENAKCDSNGNYFLLNGNAIRTPLIEWAKNKGLKVVVHCDDILDFNPTGDRQ